MAGELSQYQKWEPLTVHRSQLKNAPYNPRSLSKKAKVKLKKNRARVGLLEPPVWNRRTGHIVGGHQRVAVLDWIHKTADYLLTVAAVDLSEQDEKEQNLFLNNSEAQGEWDLEKMEALFRDGINVDNTGFDPASVVRLFGELPSEGERRDADELERVASAVDAAKKVRAGLSSKRDDPYGDDAHYYLVLVGGNDAQRVAVTELLALADNRYQDLRLIGRLVGLLKAKGGTDAELREWVAGEHDEECEAKLLDPVKAVEDGSINPLRDPQVDLPPPVPLLTGEKDPGSRSPESGEAASAGSPVPNTTGLLQTQTDPTPIALSKTRRRQPADNQ